MNISKIIKASALTLATVLSSAQLAHASSDEEFRSYADKAASQARDEAEIQSFSYADQAANKAYHDSFQDLKASEGDMLSRMNQSISSLNKTLRDHADDAANSARKKAITASNTSSAKALNLSKNYADEKANQTLKQAMEYANMVVKSGTARSVGDVTAAASTTVDAVDTEGKYTLPETDADQAFVDTSVTSSSASSVSQSDILSQSYSYTQEYVDAAKQDAIQTANSYTDSKIKKSEKKMSAGIAGVGAMASIPYDNHRYSFGLGASSFNGESAIAGGVQMKVNNQIKVRLNAAMDTNSKATIGVGASYGFD